MRFAFYGRVSTEDQQDPKASYNWQMARSQALTSAHGPIVAEFFDMGHSRSLPWKRRPKASALLSALRAPDRGFEAVVIGEPHRAFYGNQFSLVFPVFQHYGVALWVPEVGGSVDPESEAHDLVMSVFGGMSKGERTRIKVRVRSAMLAQAKVEGRFLGGRPPYGYRLADAGAHPNPAKAADGKRLHVLELDPDAAPVVERIFADYLGGTGVFALAQRLTADGIRCPSAHDPARNQHRCGLAWSKSAVRAILGNPRYTGHQVWARQRKAETLLDVEDVSLGYETKLKWNDKTRWVWSERPAHPSIVSVEDFQRAQERLASRGPSSSGRTIIRTRHPYLLRGLLFCGVCRRRMQGNFNNGLPHYRCRFPSEYALANKVEHPTTVYVREDRVVKPLDTWLATALGPERVERTLTAMEATQPDVDPTTERLRRALDECERKLGRHRAALEAGADPALVAGWSREIQTEQARLAAQLRAASRAGKATPRMSRSELKALVRQLGDILNVLQDAHPADKAEMYKKLGLRLTYDRDTNTVLAQTQPTNMCAVAVSEGGLEPPCP